MGLGRLPNWTVQHENDKEPTFVVDTTNDPEGDHAIEFPASLPWEHRVKLAKQVAAYLNSNTVKNEI